MRAALLLLALTALPLAAHAAGPAADTAACTARHAELTKQADQFNGDPMIKRLIQADLRRATSELIEGDADECMEALDHATKLLAGNY